MSNPVNPRAGVGRHNVGTLPELPEMPLTRPELLREAAALKVKGRTKMSTDELREAVLAARSA